MENAADLLKGPKNAREAVKHFGPTPGVPHSHSKPYIRSKGRKFERVRGKRNNKGVSEFELPNSCVKYKITYRFCAQMCHNSSSLCLISLAIFLLDSFLF